jgi:hypothetical protein
MVSQLCDENSQLGEVIELLCFTWQDENSGNWELEDDDDSLSAKEV